LLLECTITWRTDPVRSHSIKYDKYEDLTEAITKRGLKCFLRPFEVSALGLVLPSYCELALRTEIWPGANGFCKGKEGDAASPGN